MMYLSQLLNKPVYQNGKPFGKIIDLAIFENRPNPPVSKIEIKHGNEKLTVSPQSLTVRDSHISLPTQHIPLLPYDHKDFYLVEDLLDKQVIDTDGRRLVRVNDVVLDINAEFKVVGIDIGFAGVLRRLGLGALAHQTTIIPWNVIEAFDYQTGNVRIKLKQTSLNTLHPADIADILEEAGTKERLGIVEALDARQAARALEEADEETQISILENLTPDAIKNIVNKMHIAELADVFNDLNPAKAKEVQNALGIEKVQKIRKLLAFSDEVAGGMMHPGFFQAKSTQTVKEVIKEMEDQGLVPETITVTNPEGKLLGTINSKGLLIVDKLSLLSDNLTDKKFVYVNSPFEDIVELFAQYNLRTLTVVDADKKPVGIILIDDILKIVEEENENEDI
ncbi:MAG TPA: CBS domain-containing protein [Patescibacteria group bacterium]